MLNACIMRMTNCRPRLEKVVIFENMYDIVVELRLQSPTINGKEPIVPDDVDTSVDDDLSSGRSPSPSLSSAKNARESTKARLCKRPSHHPALNDNIIGTSHGAWRETGKGQN